MPYQFIGVFPVNFMLNQFNLSDWYDNDESDLYKSIDLINLEEPVRVASTTRINLEEPIRGASTTRIHSLCVGWRNLFSSCAVVSVFGSGGK